MEECEHFSTPVHSITSRLLMGFYEEIVADYDSMTRFQERIQRETEILQKWIARYHFRSALDVACGTGLHPIILAQLGVHTVGADISEAMLEKARSHTRELGLQISWIQSSMEQIRQKIDGNFDAILCLGNSLPHLLTQPEIDATFGNFAQLLNPNGIAVIQLLNYHKVLAEQNRIVGIHRQGMTEFIRFYDFLHTRIRFNLLTVHWQDGKASHTLNSTTLYPYQKNDLELALHGYGFSNIEYYGDMQFSPFEEQNSSNLVIVAKKNLKET